ncbi:MAG: TIGR00730 family Rossman fold protein [Prevotellaceae bacterium]|jgi:uncharacterized protein (TIGR00730 family)|nr:TIGR00730 family Rossman fold protein [Prevotellaceae bacterium]
MNKITILENEKRICVYCASSDKIDEKYLDAADALGKIFVDNNCTLVYGGGARGLMGHIADAVMRNGGKAIGYIPRFMLEVEWGKTNITELIEVDDMHERKKRLIENVDAVVALPGGCGTLDELMEVITLKRLGQFTKPVVILNQDGFYNALVDLFEKMIDKKFMRPEHRHIWSVVSDVEDVFPAIHNAKPWSAGAIHTAAV